MKNLNKYGIDAMGELSRILSNEITKEIDKNIRKRKLDNLYKNLKSLYNSRNIT